MSGLMGRKLGRYEISALVGRGGMGDVYRARDTRLDRDVAIKVLGDVLVSDPAKIERFKREARAVARLSHPNILEIHDFGDEDGLSYAVMELLDGVDLRSKVNDGPIPFRRAVKLAQQAAEGLGAAHGAGVIHRDIKPENLFCTVDGRLKILDFGLAHLKEPLDSEAAASGTTLSLSLTGEGVLLGTPRYMSPEQIRGQEAGAASDIFSLGCVIYEMISGRHPFRRETGADTMSAILSDDPEPLSETVLDVPAGVDELVLRCLEKRPEDRFESARDLGFALRGVSDSRGTSGRVVRRRPWKIHGLRAATFGAAVVVVLFVAGQQAQKWQQPPPGLPEQLHVGLTMFQALDDDEELHQTALGLTRLVTDGLVRLEPQAAGRMWVVPANQQRFWKRGACELLHTKYNITVCVEGTLRRSGDLLILRLEAVDAASGVMIGSQTIEDGWGNLNAAFQTAPVARAATLLGLESDDALIEALEQVSTNVTLAFAAYLRGSGLLFDSGGEVVTREAVGLLERAIELDPLFQTAWEVLATGYHILFEQTRDRQWLDKGQEAIARAIDRHPSAHAYRILAELRAARGDTPGGIEALKKAVDLDPKCADAYSDLGEALRIAGELGGAEHALQRAINLRPGYWPYLSQLGLLYFQQGNYDAAANQYRQVTLCAPLYAAGFSTLGAAHFYLGDEASAEKMFKRSITLRPEGNFSTYSNLGTLYFGQARFADAAAMFEKAIAEQDLDHRLWGNLGFAHAYGANPEKAISPLRRAIELAEDTLSDRRDDIDLLASLASYHGTLGDVEETVEYLETVIALNPTNPLDLLTIGEAYHDIDHREEAIHWIRKALDAGLPQDQLETRPTLRDLLEELRLDDPPSGA